MAYFITIYEEDSGKKIIRQLIRSVRRLENFPNSGRLGRTLGTREIIPVKLPYRVIYSVKRDKSVEILHIEHTSRVNWHYNQ
jgi:plasmid stabilization system protein ParE